VVRQRRRPAPAPRRRRPRVAPGVATGAPRGESREYRPARGHPTLRQPALALALLLDLAEELALGLAFLFGEDVDAGEVHDVLGFVEQRGNVGVEFGRRFLGLPGGRGGAVLPAHVD